MKYKKLFIIINVLNLFDIVTTLLGTKVFGLREVNPLMNNLLNINFLLFIAIKLSLVFFLMIYLERNNSNHGAKHLGIPTKYYTLTAYCVGIGAFGLIVLNNTIQIWGVL